MFSNRTKLFFIVNKVMIFFYTNENYSNFLFDKQKRTVSHETVLLEISN